MEDFVNQLSEQTFLNVSLMQYVWAAIFITIALLFRNFISKIIARVLHFFSKKEVKASSPQALELSIFKPLRKFVFYTLLYTAFVRIKLAFADFQLITEESLLAKSGLVKEGDTLNLSQFIEYILVLLLLFSFLAVIVNFISFFFDNSIAHARKEKEKEKQQILPLMKDVIRVLLWFFGTLIILAVVFGVNVGTIVTGLGIGGIAIAFAAKDSLENLLASFMVLIDKPFLIGDWIKVDNVEGKVERIGFRSTRIRSRDRSLIIIPNKKLIDNRLYNLSETGLKRILITFKIPYGLTIEDIEALQNEIKEGVAKVEGTTQFPLVFLDTVNSNDLKVSLRYFVNVNSNMRYELVSEEVNKIVYTVMNKYTKDFAYTDLKTED